MVLESVRRAARRTADWIDLNWSAVVRDLERAAPIARGRLLDVGCGNKPYAKIFAPFVTEHVGIEHEATFAKTNAANSAGPDFFYDGTRLPFEDASFDTILCAEVLEHTPDPQLLITEMARVLRPGGALVLSAPFSFRLHEEPHDYFRYTPYSLRLLMDRAGLRVEQEWPRGTLWSVIAHKLNSYLALRIGNLQALGQSLGKCGHEAAKADAPRYWTIPLVVPTMLALSAGARILDRAAPESVETLGFTIIARHAASAA